jgi:hypothetical protein
MEWGRQTVATQAVGLLGSELGQLVAVSVFDSQNGSRI